MQSTPAGNGKQRHFAVELFSLIARIFATAFALNLVMVGIVLLFVTSQAGAAQSEAMAPQDAARGTLLLRDGDAGQPAPLVHTDVAIEVGGPLARSRVVQTFRNPGEGWVEGLYVFPLPENAAVDHLRIRVGERVIEGKIQERAAARATYEDARANGQRSALVEQERPNMFTTSVANIGPGEEVVVEIAYQQTLAYETRDDMGHYTLRFPMVVGPRYIPAEHPGDDAARISPPVRHADEALNPVTLRVTLDAGVPLASVTSAYHPIRLKRDGETRRLVELADGPVPADRDFELNWTLAPGTAPAATLFVETGESCNHALLMLTPPTRSVTTQRLPREVVFVIDTSGSMHGASIAQAREALALALQRLPPGDRFNIIEFNSASSAVFAEARAATPANIGQAVAWVRSLRAHGGTEMASALSAALDGAHDAKRVRQVVFLTDGAVANEEALFGLIERRLGDSRLFTVGIGSAPNSHFMRRAARAGGGTFTYVGKIDEVQEKMSALFTKLESPVLKGISVHWPSGVVADTVPQNLPDLYLGEPLLIAAELDGLEAGDVIVRGTSGEIRWESRLALAQANRGVGVAALWARGKVDALLDDARAGGAETDVRAAIVALGIAHHLVTRYTSLVAVDLSPARPADQTLHSHTLATELPHGWTPALAVGTLPRGATDARWHLLVGALALLLLVGLHRYGRPPVRAGRDSVAA